MPLPDKSVHERALRYIVDSVAANRHATAGELYLADVAAVALGEANPTPGDRGSWLGNDDPTSREKHDA